MRTLLAALFLVAGLVVFPAAAESPLVVDIPFPFYAGDKLLPAGEYAIGPFDGSPTLFRVTSRGGGAILTNHLVRDSKQGERTCVQFNKYSGDRYFLAAVNVEGGLSRTMMKSERERQVVTSTLITGLKPNTVTLLARLR
ncbi:MAG: hypothetical protein IPM24_04280 [Bryobacterales bacterium]|nr:hypothetical protein [Bryobacterales bacterium]